MSKPPKTTPHSDIDGIHEDEARNVDSAVAAGEGTKDLAEAHRKSVGRPRYEDVESESGGEDPAASSRGR